MKTTDSWPVNGRRPTPMPADVKVGEGPAAYRKRKAASAAPAEFRATVETVADKLVKNRPELFGQPRPGTTMRKDGETAPADTITVQVDTRDVQAEIEHVKKKVAAEIAKALEDRNAIVKQRDALVAALRPLVDMDTSERKTKTHGYMLGSPYGKAWDKARKLLETIK